MKTCLLLLASACLIMSALAVPDLPHRLHGGLVHKLWRQRMAEGEDRHAMPLAAVPVQWYTQTLNHTAGPKAGTFQQRFWANTEYFDSATGPLFLYICGEAPCSGPPGGWVRDLAQMHGAAVITLEHRFYGDSVPGNDFSVANLMNLNLDNVLADLAGIIDFYNTQVSGQHEWFTFGGSYSGALSAMMRIRYPDHTAGSLASSGVINTIFNFVEFDEQVAASAGPACAAVLRATTAAIETAAAQGQNVRAMFGVRDGLSDGDFYYMVADSGAQAVQYGSRELLCKTMMAVTEKDQLIETYVNLTRTLWGPDFTTNCFYDTQCLASDPSRWQPSSRAWRWQKCFQMAYLQAAPAQGAIRSQAVSLDYCVQQCKTVFGSAVDPEAGSAAVLAAFGGAHPHSPDNLNPTSIFYSNGGDDPWQRAAVQATIDAQEPEDTAHCVDCGHCGDLFAPKATDPPQLTAQRASEAAYIKQWLDEAAAKHSQE